MFIGIDQSKRSTAIVAMTRYYKMIDFELINPIYQDKEELIIYQWNNIKAFIERVKLIAPYGCISGIALEGAAFTAVGQACDLLWGIQWYIRTRLIVEYPEVPVGILSPATWRSSLLTRKEQQEWKAKYGKIGLKHGVISKLPENDKQKFDDYIELHRERLLELKGFKPDSISKKYKECIFDLGDAWGIANHRVILASKDIIQPKLIRRQTNG
jgi:hypothetical protein